MTDSDGDSEGTIKYYPYGDSRNSTGTIATDKKFTGQRLDGTGLYYYNARYYDPTIGRFISADTIVPDPANPQSLNRYSYCLNNPLKYNDPSGHQYEDDYYYESLCEEYGVDPDDGYAFFLDGDDGLSGVVN
ncbi:RHS repeat-associated core domain-containing protein [Chloroflexota bacterium]